MAREVKDGKIIKDDPHALQHLESHADSFRSRELVTEKVIDPLEGRFPDDVVAALEPEFQKLVYGDEADKGKKSRQTLLLGKPELDWLASETERLAAAAGDAAAAKKAVVEWRKDKNFKAMSEGAALPGGSRRGLVRPHGHLRSGEDHDKYLGAISSTTTPWVPPPWTF